MRQVFIVVYLGVLIVLFVAWYLYGVVAERRSEAETARVYLEAHGGGARLVADELSTFHGGERRDRLEQLRREFGYSIDVIPMKDLPQSTQSRLTNANATAFWRAEPDEPCIVARLSNESEVVRLGPFPNLDGFEIEASFSGWINLTARRLESVDREDRKEKLEQLQNEFSIPLQIAKSDELPRGARGRVARGDRSILFNVEEEGGDESWYIATPIDDRTSALQLGPLPGFERVERQAAATTLALVLIPAAIAIAFILRPVARQLRRVENAAQEIAAGDLSARVDVRRVRLAKQLAQSFNHMAGRTETLVRTQRELLQAVSHELRTPLSRIRFAIDLLASAKTEQEREERLQSLDEATEEIDGLVGELLDYVRAETASIEPNIERLSVNDILDSTIPKYKELHPSISFSPSDSMREDEVLVFAQRSGFQRAISNLLSNASRFAKSIVTVSASTDGESTTIDVDDDGPGIVESDRDRVFEPFVRLDDERNSNGSGVGLGLALVRRIIGQHGGTVSVLSSPSGGCRIRMSWPIHEPKQA